MPLLISHKPLAGNGTKIIKWQILVNYRYLIANKKGPFRKSLIYNQKSFSDKKVDYEIPISEKEKAKQKRNNSEKNW